MLNAKIKLLRSFVIVMLTPFFAILSAKATTVSTDTAIAQDAECTGVDFATTDSLTISGAGHLSSTGTMDIDRDENDIFQSSSPSSAAVNLVCVTARDSASGVDITVNTSSSDTGIVQEYASRHTAATHVERGAYLKTLNVENGTIKSDDTAVFLTTSDSTSNQKPDGSSDERITHINVEQGGSIIGHRHAIRQDEVKSVPQFVLDELGTSVAKDHRNDGSSQQGYLSLKVTNAGTIASDPSSVSVPHLDETGAGYGFAFYIGGDNRVRKYINIENTADGSITGLMSFGTFDNIDRDEDVDYIQSEVAISNSGHISSATLKSDFNTKMTFVNNSDGTVIIEDNPLVQENYAISTYDGGPARAYDVYPATQIQMHGINDSSFTNYGTVIGSINSSSSQQSVNLEGGNYTGRIAYAGRVNFGDDLGQHSTTGRLLARNDQFTKNYSTFLDLGRNTHNIQADTDLSSEYDGSLDISGLEDSDDDGVIDNGTHTISTTRADDGTFGRMNFEGTTHVQSGVKLDINSGDSYQYLEHGTTYTIIDGEYGKTGEATGSDVKKVEDEDIIIDGVARNVVGSVTYSTQVQDAYDDGGETKYADLILRISRASAQEISDNEYIQNLYNIINDPGTSATGSIRQLQEYIDTVDGGYAAVEAALEATEPLNNGDVEAEMMSPILSSTQAANDRMDQFFGINPHAGISTVPVGPQASIVETHDLQQIPESPPAQEFPFKREDFGDDYADTSILTHCYEKLKGSRRYILVEKLSTPSGRYYRFVKRMKQCYDKQKGLRYLLVNRDNSDVKYKSGVFAPDSVRRPVKSYNKRALGISTPEKSGMSFGDPVNNVTVWGQAFDTTGRQKNRQYQGYKSDSSGVVFGVDKNLGNKALIGVSVSYAETDIKSNNRSRQVAMDNYQVNIYGGKMYQSHYFWDAVAGFSWNNYNSARAIATLGYVANAKYNGRNYIARLRGGKAFYNVRASNFAIIPELSATFVSTNTNAYQESGASFLNLTTEKNSDEYLEARGGVNVNYDDFIRQELHLKYRTHLSYGYNVMNKGQRSSLGFADQNVRFNTRTSKTASGSFRLGLGIDLKKINASSVLSLDYVLDKRVNYTSHSGLAKIKYGF